MSTEFTEYPSGLRVAWFDAETRRLFETTSDVVFTNGSRPDTSQSYFLDLIGRIDAITGGQHMAQIKGNCHRGGGG